MADARCRRITITVEADGAVFQASGRTIDFPGYLRAYVEGSDDPEADLADRDVVLPGVAVGESLDCRGMEPKSHTTQPPNRYSEASLTRALEEMGIGRPSTYAADHRHHPRPRVRLQDQARQRAGAHLDRFCRLAIAGAHLPDLVDYQFTAAMEDELDAISRGESNHLEYLKHFYFGNDHPGLKEQLVKNKVERDRRPRRQPHLHRHSRGPAGGLRPRGPLWPLPRARRPPRQPSRPNAARRTDARRRPGDARQGEPGRRAAGYVPGDAASRSSSRSAASAPTSSGAPPTTTRSRKTPRC